MYDTIARRKLVSVHSEVGGPVHQHRDPSLSYCIWYYELHTVLYTCSPPSIGRTLCSPSSTPRPPLSSSRVAESVAPSDGDPHGQRCRHKSTKEAIRRRRRRHPGKSPPRLRRECSQTAVSGIDQYRQSIDILGVPFRCCTRSTPGRWHRARYLDRYLRRSRLAASYKAMTTGDRGISLLGDAKRGSLMPHPPNIKPQINRLPPSLAGYPWGGFCHGHGHDSAG
jgi:hypothetical protein